MRSVPSPSADLQWFHERVVVLRWPEQSAEVARLARHEVPHLLLVEPGAPAPVVASCVGDWVRLPVEDADVRSRLDAHARCAARHPTVPEVDDFGQLSYRSRRVFLLPTDERIARVLVASFDRGVPERELFARVWPEAGNVVKVRVQVSRLRAADLSSSIGIAPLDGVHRARVREVLWMWTADFRP